MVSSASGIDSCPNDVQSGWQYMGLESETLVPDSSAMFAGPVCLNWTAIPQTTRLFQRPDEPVCRSLRQFVQARSIWRQEVVRISWSKVVQAEVWDAPAGRISSPVLF